MSNDGEGRVVEVRRDDGGLLDDPVVWQWDHQQGETEVTDPRGNATTYHQDGLGVGDLAAGIGERDAGETIELSYDDHDRLVPAVETDVDTGEELASWGYGYDGDSNLTELTVDGDTVRFTANDAQQLTSSSDGDSFDYDDAGRLQTPQEEA